mgnify:CR=1 FL=1
MDDEFDKLLSDLEGYTKKQSSNPAASSDNTPVKGPQPPRPSSAFHNFYSLILLEYYFPIQKLLNFFFFFLLFLYYSCYISAQLPIFILVSPQPKAASPSAVSTTQTHVPSAGPTNQNLVVTGRGVTNGAAGESTEFLVATKDVSPLNASELDVGFDMS